MVRHYNRPVTRALAVAALVAGCIVALAMVATPSVGASSQSTPSAATASVARAVAGASANAAIGPPVGGVAAGAANNVEVVQTSADLSQHLQRMPDVQFSSGRPRGVPVINVNDGIRYQKVRGVGAAMTDTSAWLMYNQLTPGGRYQLMQHL